MCVSTEEIYVLSMYYVLSMALRKSMYLLVISIAIKKVKQVLFLK